MKNGSRLCHSHALTKSGIDLKLHLYRMYGEGRSAGFELTDPVTGDVLFTMDVDVNRPVPQIQMYEIADVRFLGASRKNDRFS